MTWLADLNHAATSGYAAANAGGSGSTQILSDGRMGWAAANDWATGLVYGGFEDWRLPLLNASDTTCSRRFNRTRDSAGQIAHLALFSHGQTFAYGSGLKSAPSPALAWGFTTDLGYQGTHDESDALYALAVRSGDVADLVPEPQTWALAPLALGATAGARRTRLFEAWGQPGP